MPQWARSLRALHLDTKPYKHSLLFHPCTNRFGNGALTKRNLVTTPSPMFGNWSTSSSTKCFNL